MRKILLFLLVLLTACAAPTASPNPATPKASITSTAAASPTPTVILSPTPSPTPTIPPPPLSRPLYPETWLQSPLYGAAAPDQGLLLRLRRGYTFTADLSPDGDELALARLYGVYLCPLPQSSPEALACHAYLDNQGSPVIQVRYSPSGHTLATLDTHGAVRLWDLRHPDALPQNLPLFPERAGIEIEIFTGGLAFSPDGRFLAAADGFRLALWDLETGQPVPLGPPVNLSDVVTSPHWYSVTFDPQGILAAGAWEGQWVILDPTQPQDSLHLFPALRDQPILDLTFTPRGDLLLLYRDGILRLVSRQTGETLAESQPLPDHPLLDRFHPWGMLTGAGITAFGAQPFHQNRLLLPASDGSLLLFSLHSLQLEHTLQRPQAPVYFAESVFASFTPDGRRIVGVWGDGTVAVWQADEEKATAYAPGGSEGGEGLSFDPLGRQMSAGFHGAAPDLLWHPPDGQVSEGFGGYRAYSSNGCFQAPYHFNQSDTLEVFLTCRWPPTQEPLLTLEYLFGTFPIPPLFLDPYPWIAVVADESQPVQILNLQDGTPLHTLQDDRLQGTYALAADSAAGRLYQGSQGSRIGVWNLESGQLEALWAIPNPLLDDTYPEYAAQVIGLALSSDGSILVAARNDGMVAVLETDTGAVRQTFNLKADTRIALTQLALTADAHWLVALGTNLNQGMVLDMQSGEQVAAIPLAGNSETEDLVLSPDERFVVIHGLEGSVAVWSLPDLLARSGETNLLPLPLLAEGAAPLPAFHTRYTVTLTLGEQTIPLLKVIQEGQQDAEPPRRHLTFEGAGWPVTGEALWRADGWLGFGPLIARTSADEKWYVTNYAAVPPTAPLLRPWGWTYQGFREGAHHYRSTVWTSAPLPPSAWLSRALDGEVVHFRPQSFLGEVALAPDGLLLGADLTWEGEISTSQNRQEARIEAHYRLEGTEPVDISFPAEEDIVGPVGLASTQAKMVGEFPLYPGLLKDPEEEYAYFIRQPAESILAWYQEQLPLYGFANLELKEESILGMFTTYYLTAEKDGKAYQLIISSTLGMTVVNFPPPEP